MQVYCRPDGAPARPGSEYRPTIDRMVEVGLYDEPQPDTHRCRRDLGDRDVQRERVLAFDQLYAGRHGRERELKAGEVLVPQRLPSLSIAVADIFNRDGR